MEIFMKSFEHRLLPVGSVYRIEISSFKDLMALYAVYTVEVGKISGSVKFKKNFEDNKWLDYREFLGQYGKDLGFPNTDDIKSEYIGDENFEGKFNKKLDDKELTERTARMLEIQTEALRISTEASDEEVEKLYDEYIVQVQDEQREHYERELKYTEKRDLIWPLIWQVKREQEFLEGWE